MAEFAILRETAMTNDQTAMTKHQMGRLAADWVVAPFSLKSGFKPLV
jgi:hypothetical protein